MEKNKTAKYIKYAVGEIILVVIGILIALQINNWNENRKQKEVQNTYYHQILVDLEKDITYANAKLSQLDSSVLKYISYKNLFSIPHLQLNTAIEKIRDLEVNTYNIAFKTTTIVSLINTGDIKLLSANLRDKLMAYYGKREQLSDISKSNNANALTILQSALKNGGIVLLDNRIEKQKDLMNALNLENKLPQVYLDLETFYAWKIDAEKISIAALKDIISEADMISDLIHDELE